MFGKKETADLEIFAIFDTKAQSYRPPAYALNKLVAIRDLTNVIRENPKHEFAANSEDFQLFKLGSYCYQKGLITSHPPEHVTNLHEIKATLQ